MVVADCWEELLCLTDELEFSLDVGVAFFSDELELSSELDLSLELESPLSDESFAELEELSAEMLELEDSSVELDDSFFSKQVPVQFFANKFFIEITGSGVCVRADFALPLFGAPA